MKNIIILTEPRTGSNLLCELFYSYNSVRVLNEFFTDRTDKRHTPHYTALSEQERNLIFKYFKISDKTIPGLIAFLNNNPGSSLEFLNKIIQKYKLIKIHGFIFDDLNLSFVLDDPETKFIVLDRTSKIKQYVSSQVSAHLEQWHNVDTSQIKIQVNLKEYLKAKQSSIEWFNRIENLLREKNHNFLKINYENDLENIDQDHLTLKISNWLNNHNVPSSTNGYKLGFFKKQNLSNLDQVIINYKEIEPFLEQ